MPQSAEQFGQDLSAVHEFYLFLLESALATEIPVPPSIAHDTDVLHRFVLLLDMAVTPQMVRDGLRNDDQREAAEALLRFFAAKDKRRREDRDKVDVIATALYRVLVPEQAGELAEEGDFQRTMKFEEDLKNVYQGIPIPDPAPEHMQLVREFQFLRDEVGDFRHFDELTDSGVIQKVRDLKQTLDGSFLHPSVLATVASYNVFFGHKFDHLFKRAANEVKTFAAKVQQDGGSIMSRVDGDVIVKHLADVDEGKILGEEYSRAQEHLRHISKLKKAVDNRRFGKSAPPPKAPITAAGATKLGGPIAGGAPPLMSLSEPVAKSHNAVRAGAPAPQIPPPSDRRLGPHSTHAQEAPAYNVPRSSSSMGDVELQRMHAVQVTIRSFVRAADPHSASVVPLPHGNCCLTGSEVEAYRADYGNEKSFRADFVGALMQMAALEARLQAEILEFQKTRYTAYNWKPHADSMAHLLTAARSITDAGMQLVTIAEQRGLADKVASINESLDKVRNRAHEAAEALQSIGS